MNVTNVVVTALLGGELPSYNISIILTRPKHDASRVIMITRLYAMYQRSRITLIFLVIIFLAVNITCGVITAILLERSSTGKPYLLA
jgi:hypothetical protein